MMKTFLAGMVLTCGFLVCGVQAAPQSANTSARHAQALHFARGAYELTYVGTLSKTHRFYTLRMNAGQHLKISAQPDAKSGSQVVPLIFVTPPCGKYNGDKTNAYAEDSSRAGIYKIEVAANQMASKAAVGRFVLHVAAH